jgi:phosphatidate cytidylyltransferase
MTTDPGERLFGWQHAFDHRATVWMVTGVLGALAGAALLIQVLAATGRLSAATRTELWRRLGSWCVMAPLFLGPVLLGAAWTIGAVAVLSLLCYREFARATGLFREREVSGLVVLGILAITFACIDHWYDLFMALTPLSVVMIAAIAVAADQPRGYIQRTALGVFAFMFFGTCLGHLGYFANDTGYRPVVLLILVTVELNDVFAYTCGRLFGRRKLAPATSPNKTWAGAIGAMILTTLLMLALGALVFEGTEINRIEHLVALGLIVSVGGQLGDLMLSAIKRDLGLKDFAATIPGHGGLLDRFDSLILVAPAVFHYIGYLQGIGLNDARRILTGG